MNNPLALSSIFFKEQTPEKWQEAAEAGITAAEISLGTWGQFNNNPEIFLAEAQTQYKLITKAGIKVCSFHLPFQIECFDVAGPDDVNAHRAVEIHKKIIDWVIEKKIGIAVLHGGREPVPAAERNERFNRAKNSIKVLNEYIKNSCLILAVEVLPRTCLGNCAGELLELIDYGKNAKICFDVNHLLLESHKEFISKTANHIITTHFSDYDGIDEKHWIPGAGIINWKELIIMLKNSGYTGNFLFELQGTAKSNPKLNRDFNIKELTDSFINAVR